MSTEAGRSVETVGSPEWCLPRHGVRRCVCVCVCKGWKRESAKGGGEGPDTREGQTTRNEGTRKRDKTIKKGEKARPMMVVVVVWRVCE